jgi:hypothetical protein
VSSYVLLCLAGGAASQAPPECVEEISSCLLGFCSPHVLLYATAAIQMMQDHTSAAVSSTLLANGILPLVGRPEYLQVGQRHWNL